MSGVTTLGISIEIISDVICPYCFIGVKRLLTSFQRFNDSHPSQPIEPRLHILPFSINPSLTETPVSRKANRTAIYGEARGEQVTANVQAALATVGVKSNTDGMVSSSHLAQRVEALAYDKLPSQEYTKLVLEVFESYHVDGHPPSDGGALARIGMRHGLFGSRDEGLEFMDSEGYDEEVKGGYAKAKSLGVSGVPFFIFEGKWTIPGAATEEDFIEVLVEVVQSQGK